MKCYRDLTVWQQGIDLVTEVYKLSRQFPSDERYALCSQLQRASIAVPSNIAEGHARSSRNEFVHFLSVSLGSLAEVETHLVIANRLAYITNSKKRKIFDQTSLLGKSIRNLQQTLEEKAD